MSSYSAARSDARYDAEKNVNYKIRCFAREHPDEDVVIAWNIEEPKPVDEKNVYLIYQLPVKSQEVFESKQYYTYTQAYDVAEQYKVRGDFQDFSLEKDWRGDYHLQPNFGPDQYYTTHHTETRDETSSVTIKAGVKCVKKGNGPQIVQLDNRLREGRKLYDRAMRYKKEGKGMFFKDKAKWWTVAYWVDHMLFFLLSFLFVALLPELGDNNQIYDLQLELIIFKAIAGSDPIPLCSMIGIDPLIACLSIFGALIVLFLIQMLFRYKMDYEIMFSTPCDTAMLVIGILDVLAIASVYYLPFAEGLEDGILRVICMFLSWIFIVLINGKLLITLGAPVFFVWSFVKGVYNPEVYFLTGSEKAERKMLDIYLEHGLHQKYQEMRRQFLSLFAS